MKKKSTPEQTQLTEQEVILVKAYTNFFSRANPNEVPDKQVMKFAALEFLGAASPFIQKMMEQARVEDFSPVVSDEAAQQMFDAIPSFTKFNILMAGLNHMLQNLSELE